MSQRLFLASAGASAPVLHPGLAAEIGMTESLVLLYVERRAGDDPDVIDDAGGWAQISGGFLHADAFPFLTPRQLNNVIAKLEADGLIVTAPSVDRYDQRRLVRPDYAGIARLKSCRVFEYAGDPTADAGDDDEDDETISSPRQSFPTPCNHFLPLEIISTPHQGDASACKCKHLDAEAVAPAGGETKPAPFPPDSPQSPLRIYNNLSMQHPKGEDGGEEGSVRGDEGEAGGNKTKRPASKPDPDAGEDEKLALPAHFWQRLQAAWNDTIPAGWNRPDRKIHALTPARKRHIRARIREGGPERLTPEWWAQLFAELTRHEMLAAADTWGDFSWIVEKPDNFAKVLEGKYRRAFRPRQSGSAPEPAALVGAHATEPHTVTSDCLDWDCTIYRSRYGAPLPSCPSCGGTGRVTRHMDAAGNSVDAATFEQLTAGAQLRA